MANTEFHLWHWIMDLGLWSILYGFLKIDNIVKKATANPVYTRWLHCRLGNCLLTTKFVEVDSLLAPKPPPRLYR